MLKALSVLILRGMRFLSMLKAIKKNVIIRPVTPEGVGSSPIGPARKSKKESGSSRLPFFATEVVSAGLTALLFMMTETSDKSFFKIDIYF